LTFLPDFLPDFLPSLSAALAERVKALFLWWPCDHDHIIYVQLPPSLNMLLCPWIRHFTMIISTWWLRTSS